MAQNGDECMTEASVFEGIFGKGVPLTPQLTEGLRRVGYDPDNPRPKYPSRVWCDSLEVARMALFPGLAPEQGFRELGKLFIEGFARTFVGKVIFATMPLTNPERILSRLPGQLKVAASTAEVHVVPSRENHCKVEFRRAEQVAAFALAGSTELVLRRCRPNAQVRVLRHAPDSFDFEVTW